LPSVRNVSFIEEDKTQKRILFDQKFGVDFKTLPDKLKDFLNEKELEVKEHEVTLSYDNIN